MKKDKEQLYRITRFSQDQLVKLQKDVAEYAAAIGGLPQKHSDIFEKRGWLLPFLFSYDDLLWGRWSYWLDILHKGTIEGSKPIPQIQWVNPSQTGHQATHKMLKSCLSHHEATIDHFADWLLWGLSGSVEKPRISEKLNEHFYREFDLFLILDNPTDYLSIILCEETGKGYKSGLGYFPTPFSVTQMMVDIVHGGEPAEELKRKSVMDSCVGCGALLLPASNYFLRAYAQDISGIAIKLCKAQMYFYAPWYASPGNVTGFEVMDVPIPLTSATPHRKVTSDQLAFVF